MKGRPLVSILIQRGDLAGREEAMNVSRLGRIFSVAVLVALLAACGPGTGSTSSKTLHVIGTWGGSEQASFMAMVKPWETQTGNKVSYEGSRDLNALLTTRVKAGNPPDLAGLPGHRRRERCRLGLAGHRLGQRLFPPPGGTNEVRSLGRQPGAVERTRDEGGLAVLWRGRQ